MQRTTPALFKFSNSPPLKSITFRPFSKQNSALAGCQLDPGSKKGCQPRQNLRVDLGTRRRTLGSRRRGLLSLIEGWDAWRAAVRQLSRLRGSRATLEESRCIHSDPRSAVVLGDRPVSCSTPRCPPFALLTRSAPHQRTAVVRLAARHAQQPTPHFFLRTAFTSHE